MFIKRVFIHFRCVKLFSLGIMVSSFRFPYSRVSKQDEHVMQETPDNCWLVDMTEIEIAKSSPH